jgi:hypothetical protein
VTDSPQEPRYLQIRDLHKAINADVLKKAVARGTQLPWLKDMTGQLEDPEYNQLSLSERGLLKDLRLLAARRGNKILNDEKYIRVQVGCSLSTRLNTKLRHLRDLRFLEPYNSATNQAANDLFPSHLYLDESETAVSPISRLEVEVDKKDLDLSSKPKTHSANGLPTTTDVNQRIETYVRTIGLHIPNEASLREDLEQRFKTTDLNQAVDLWRTLTESAAS